MTQRGETDNYSVADHIKAIYRHAGKDIIDYAIVNLGRLDEDLESKYMNEASKLVVYDEKESKISMWKS